MGKDPRTVALDDGRGRAYVANRGSASVSVVDLVTGQRLAHIEVGHNPRAIALSPGGAAAYVNNTLAAPSPSSTPRPAL